MRNPISEGASCTKTNYGTHSLANHELWDVNSAGSNLSTPIMSEEIAKQIKTATDRSAKQLKRLCDSMKGTPASPSKT